MRRGCWEAETLRWLGAEGQVVRNRALEVVDGNLQGAGRCNQAGIITGQFRCLALSTQEFYGGEMQGVQGTDGTGKRLEGSQQNGGCQLDQCEAPNKRPDGVSVGPAEVASVNPRPHLVFQQPASGKRLAPQPLRGDTVLREELGKHHGAIQIDHRSARSCASSRRSWRSVVTGCRGGGSAPGKAGGAIHPRRTASASLASARRGLRPSRGGPSSATTRSRSVTRTVSPPPARRTYSLNLFLRTLSPTARMSAW